MEKELFKILLVEDNEAHAELFRRCLDDNYQMVTLKHVVDGQAGLDYLNNDNDYEDKESFPRPNLVLLDLKLPKMSGLQLLASIKNDDELTTLPVVIFSSSQAYQDVSQALKLGANSYLTKPTDFNTFTFMADCVISYWSNCDQLSKLN